MWKMIEFPRPLSIRSVWNKGYWTTILLINYAGEFMKFSCAHEGDAHG